MIIKYIQKAIEYRLPDNYSQTHKLNDLTNTGYLMKPFEKDGNPYTNEYGTQLDSFGEILSPEIRENGEIKSAFKSTGIQMNVPYVNKGTPQTLTLNTINNISIKDATENPKFDVIYTSTDKDLEKYTDVFVEYGPAKEIRTVNADGSYSWQVEVLLDEIPKNASYPIEINVVASNLGKWETTYGATTSQKVYITNENIKSGIYLDGSEQTDYDTAVNAAIADDNSHTVTIYSDYTTALSGSARIGSLYVASGKTVTVNAPFTTSGSHAEITPGEYTEGAAIVTYSDGVTPSVSDFTVAKNGETAWYTYVDGQSLKLTSAAPYAITSDGNVTVQSTASKGETVLVTVPNGYVENSLVVSGIKNTNITKVSDNTYSFTMPEKPVQVSCLVNTDPKKLVIVGTHDTYYVKKDNKMKVSFDVPALDNGYIYKTANVNIPARANQGNAVNMTGVMNGESYTVTNANANISGTGTVIPGENNVLTVTNDGSNGVDYYSYIGGWNNTGYDYPVTAANLSTLTLTKAVKADMTRLTTDTTNADTNSDAAGYYIEDIAIPSWNPALKWKITFNDGKTAQSKVSLPILSGSGSISMGIILYGELGGTEASYTTADIKNVTVIE